MRWLHLSDLHVGRESVLSQQTALKKLVSKISDVLDGSVPVDAILVTGDIANAGLESQYEDFHKLIMEPLLKIPACCNAKTFGAPGNHDSTSESLPVTWDSIGNGSREVFFQESLQGQKKRKNRAEDFTGYSTFQTKYNMSGPDPLKVVSDSFQIHSSSGTINIITTNTSFFSYKDKDIPDREKIPSPTASLRTIFDNIPSGATKSFVLGHHPIDWFIYNDRAPFKTLLTENNAIYLHGHIHEPSVSHSHKGLLSLGFGAAYKSNLEKSQIYHNSFAVCELDGDQLHIALYHWDAEHGRWAETTNLPDAFEDKSELINGGYKLSLTGINTIAGKRSANNDNFRSPPIIRRVMGPGEISEPSWRSILLRLGLNDNLDSSIIDFKIEETSSTRTTFSYKNAVGRHYIECISGRSHILSRPNIETANTEIDYQDYKSYTIVTFGDTDEDARTAYLRLSSKKPLKLITATDLAIELSSIPNSPQAKHLEKLDAAIVTADLIIDGTSLLLLIKDAKNTSWFYLVGEDGGVLAESDSVVIRIKETEPELKHLSYSSPCEHFATVSVLPSPPQKLNTKEYLKACENEFNSVRYAALAAIGFKFQKISLSELYVEADADVDTRSRSTESLNTAIENALDELDLDAPLRTQLESQLRRHYSCENKLETGSVRSLYQQFGSVLVLGDPGSGKTCFVKNEILSYCTEYGCNSSWYRQHLPVFIPLAEAAKQIDYTNLLSVACKLAIKRGLEITESQLQDLFSVGGVAFFFDGLDEVVSIDQRTSLTTAISDLIATGEPAGNRFILTSRPAAAQIVDVPDSLHVIHLRGLTEDQMRSLAKRVLAIRFSEGEGGLNVGTEQLETKEASLIEQLLQDCKSRPGIGRLARNPLLLTLLIMIYANSERPATKRHRVYAQAIETLATVRAHQTGQRIFSDSDLRRRLGAAALAVFSNESASIPKMEEFAAALKMVMSLDAGCEVQDEEVSLFIQEVAEATGLLVIHNGDHHNQANVTFMHYSFLEYYAAVGLYNSKDYITKLPDLARQPRWKEVISLLTGIIGDHDDITPVVDSLISSSLRAEQVTLDMLLFAIDCALECDAPPEACQRLLLGAIEDSIIRGPALVDSDLRRRLANRISTMIETSGINFVFSFLKKGISSPKAAVCAAFVDLLSNIADHMPIDKGLAETFDQICSRTEPEIIIAVCEAVGKAEPLRTNPSIKLLKKAFDGSISVLFAAVRALESAPGLATYMWDKLLITLNDKRPYISNIAANVVLNQGFQWDESRSSHEPVLKALKCLQTKSQPGQVSNLLISAPKEKVDNFLSSPVSQDRLLGISFLPWVKNEEWFVLNRVIELLKTSKDRLELVAALSSLRLANTTHKILRYSDEDLIFTFFENKTRDVRIAAVRLAGAIGAKSTNDTVCLRIIDYIIKHPKDEYKFGIRALLESSKTNSIVSDFIMEQLGKKLSSTDRSEEHRWNIIELLRACQNLESGIASQKLRKQLVATLENYKEDSKIKHEILSAFANIGTFDQELFDYYIKLLKNPPVQLGNSVCKAVSLLLKRARRRLDSIRSLHPQIMKLETAILNHIDKINAATIKSGETRIRNLRVSIEHTQHILRSYNEFANRALVRSE